MILTQKEMETEIIKEKLQAIIREVVDDECLVISEDTIAEDVEGWDSLAQVLIVGEIQKEFGVRLSSAEVRNISNVGGLLDIINSKINA